MRSPRPHDLYDRRLAVRALELVLQHFNLAAVTLKLNPDDPQQAFPGAGPGVVRLFLDGWENQQRPVAVVEVVGARARVLVEHIRELVRTNHQDAFRPEDVGIVQARGQPDIDMDVDLENEIAEWGERWRTAPARPSTLPVRGGRSPSWRAATGGVRRR